MENQIIRHGEVIMLPSKLPKEAQLNKEETSVIVAHSETGHHHILETLDTSKIKVYVHGGNTYVEVPQIAKLWHQKTGVDTHKEHTVTPGIYKINLKKEFDYFEGILKTVID